MNPIKSTDTYISQELCHRYAYGTWPPKKASELLPWEKITGSLWTNIVRWWICSICHFGILVYGVFPNFAWRQLFLWFNSWGLHTKKVQFPSLFVNMWMQLENMKVDRLHMNLLFLFCCLFGWSVGILAIRLSISHLTVQQLEKSLMLRGKYHIGASV